MATVHRFDGLVACRRRTSSAAIIAVPTSITGRVCTLVRASHVLRDSRDLFSRAAVEAIRVWIGEADDGQGEHPTDVVDLIQADCGAERSGRRRHDHGIDIACRDELLDRHHELMVGHFTRSGESLSGKVPLNIREMRGGVLACLCQGERVVRTVAERHDDEERGLRLSRCDLGDRAGQSFVSVLLIGDH